MWKKKLGMIALATVGFGFACAPGANAGTDVIRDYGAQEPAYNYAPPPPRPVYYTPPPPVNVVIFPAYGYYGSHFRPYYGHHRYYAHPYWHRW